MFSLFLLALLLGWVGTSDIFQDQILKFTEEKAEQITRHYASTYEDEPYWYWIPFIVAAVIGLIVFGLLCWCSTIRPLMNTVWWVFIFLIFALFIWLLFFVPTFFYHGYPDGYHDDYHTPPLYHH